MRRRARVPPCGARVMRARRTLLQYVVPIVVGWALGCDNPASPQPSADLLPPLTGSIKVSAPTTGSDVDPNGYTATLDLLQSQSVPTNGSTTFSGVLLGVHAVQLSGVASNCSLNSSNPQTVTLTGSSATASFSVNCTATTGSLTVTTSTTGSNLDPDGYTVTVDGNQKAIGINNSVTFSGLSPGNHSVQLNGLAQNCTVSSNPRTVSITAGSTTKTTFSVGCTAPTGTLKVTTSTTGSVPTSNYTVTVDWNTASAQQIAPNNGSVTFSNLSATGHSVALSGFPANCTVTSANPQSVNVPAGGTATAPFTVSCPTPPTTGTLKVTTSTSGSVPTSNYTVTVDGNTASAQQIAPNNGSVTFSNLSATSHSVALSGFPANRSEEHTSEPSHTVISYAVFCLKKKKSQRAVTAAPCPADGHGRRADQHREALGLGGEDHARGGRDAHRPEPESADDGAGRSARSE